MPELPEVETIRKDLNSYLLKKTIKDVVIKKPKLVRGDKISFKKNLKNNSFTNIDRIGKLLIFHLSSGKFLLIHLKMTGQLIYQKDKIIIKGGHSDQKINLNLPHKHTHLIFVFSDNSNLFFNDLRQFGYLEIVSQSELEIIKNKYGINPLAKSFNSQKLGNLTKSRRTSIKNILLNQNLIAGIGNIYADEACWLAKILPSRPANSLTKSELDKLVKSLKTILKKSIKHRGTTFNNFRDATGKSGNFLKFLKVYHRQNKPCSRCHQKIIRKKIASRGTHFCSFCQK